MQSKEADAQIPISINCWPSTSGGESYVSIEYECNVELELQNVDIVIPLPDLKSGPRINSVSDFPFLGHDFKTRWSVDANPAAS